MNSEHCRHMSSCGVKRGVCGGRSSPRHCLLRILLRELRQGGGMVDPVDGEVYLIASPRPKGQEKPARSLGKLAVRKKSHNELGRHLPNANQKNTAAAFFVLHHPTRPFLKSSPLSWLGSWSGFLHPGSVHAEMVTMNLYSLALNWLNEIL